MRHRALQSARRRPTSPTTRQGSSRRSGGNLGAPTFARYAGDANTSSWSYDTLGRVTGRVDTGQVSLDYRHDGRGDLVRIEYQGSVVKELQYDEQGRLTRASDSNRRGAATFHLSTSFIYDEWGRIQEETTEFPLGS